MKAQIILAGIGGQGILFASRVLSELGLRQGLNVLGSETHGMSQRGGSVIAHLKLGSFYSPMIQTGDADILYSFHEDEAYRTLRFLKRGGACFANLVSIDGFDKKILDHLKKNEITFMAYDASRMALEIGSLMTANIMLIGFSVGTGLVPFDYDDLRDVLQSLSKKRQLEANLKAFEIGFQGGKSFKNGP